MLVFMEMFCRWYFHHGNNLAVETLLHRSLWIVGQLSHGLPGWQDSHCEQWQALMADWAGEGVCITPHLLGIFPINCHAMGEDKRFLLQLDLSIQTIYPEVRGWAFVVEISSRNTKQFSVFQKRLYFFSFSFFSVLHNVGISQTTLVLSGTCCSPCSRKMVLVMRRGGLNPISSENCGKIDLWKLKILK